MDEKKINNGWELDFSFPLGNRTIKPRQSGLTMIIDMGMGPGETRDLLEMGAGYIDFWKLGFGTSALYDQAFLKQKIGIINSSGIRIYPGGTFAEIALTQGKFTSFLVRARELGFTTIEISDGTIFLPPRERSRAIQTAIRMGFLVLAEVGKKETGETFRPRSMAEQIGRDLEDGAFKVILEARESGKNVTIFTEKGEIKKEQLAELIAQAPSPEQIIWEAPLKTQQIQFITAFGSNVNLGNIRGRDVLALESLRRGLRSDTFRLSLENKYRGTKGRDD
ncbi:MAG TPA: phosphosulfolactate synthase [Firmicutes bacterium]|nr:phosphosulfolactate synthase [Bacillota bacterium]